MDTWPRDTLTGVWVSSSQLYHLFINQAGWHLELLISAIEAGGIGSYKDDSYRMTQLLVHVGADPRSENEDDIWRLFLRTEGQPADTRDKPGGWLHVLTGPQLAIKLELAGNVAEEKAARFARVQDARFERKSTTPTRFIQRLGSDWIPDEVRTKEWFPVTPKQAKAMADSILKAYVKLDPAKVAFVPPGELQVYHYRDLVKHYFEALTKSGVKSSLEVKRRLRRCASGLNTLVAKAWDEVQALPVESGGVNQFHEGDWRYSTLLTLSRETITFDDGIARSLLTHTQAILDGMPEYAEGDEFESLLWLHDLHPQEDYEATLIIGDPVSDKNKDKFFRKILGKPWKKIRRRIGKKLPVGTLVGTLSVRKTGVGAFEGLYLVNLYGLQLTKSVGKGTSIIESKGSARGVMGQMWKPEDLAGKVDFFDASGVASGGGTGKAVGFTTMRVWGGSTTAPRAPLNLMFPGLSDAIGARGEAAVGGFLGFGTLHEIELKGGNVFLDMPDADPFELTVHGSSPEVHFPINGARLREEARYAVSVFAACELAQLSLPSARVEIHGYTDRPHTAIKNLILSRNRAISLYVWLMNILGPSFPVPELPELPPESAEIKENAGKPETELTIFDPSAELPNVVIEAHGEEEAPVELSGYAYRERRAQLYIDGVMRLSLSRRYDTVIKGASAKGELED